MEMLSVPLMMKLTPLLEILTSMFNSNQILLMLIPLFLLNLITSILILSKLDPSSPLGLQPLELGLIKIPPLHLLELPSKSNPMSPLLPQLLLLEDFGTNLIYYPTPVSILELPMKITEVLVLPMTLTQEDSYKPLKVETPTPKFLFPKQWSLLMMKIKITTITLKKVMMIMITLS